MAKQNTGTTPKRAAKKTTPKKTTASNVEPVDETLAENQQSDVENLREELDAEQADAGKSNPDIDQTPDDTTSSADQDTDTPSDSDLDSESSVENSESSETESAEIVTITPTIVIPYKESAAAGTELLYAVRAWAKHLPDHTIVIIGDKPDFASDELIHIPHTPTSSNPQVDVAQKLLIACESDLVSDYFIVSNDDIYPVAPINLSYIDILTAEGPLKQRGAEGGVYRKNALRTLKALKKNGVEKPWDFATHSPVGFWKKQLKEVIEDYAADQEGYLVATLYFNIVWPDCRPIIVDNGYNANHAGTRSYVGSFFRSVSASKVKEVFDQRIFINNNDAGWSSVEPFLKKLFPEKSRFEK